MLELIGVYGVEDPVEAKYRVQDHREIVDRWTFVTEYISEKRIFGVGIAEA